MAVERIDYATEDDYRQALQWEAEEEAEWQAMRDEEARLAFDEIQAALQDRQNPLDTPAAP